MTNETSLLEKEVSQLIRQAYILGLKKSKKEKEILDIDTILNQFLVFISKFKPTIVDSEIRYSDAEFVYTKEHLIDIFKLTHGYDED